MAKREKKLKFYPSESPSQYYIKPEVKWGQSSPPPPFFSFSLPDFSHFQLCDWSWNTSPLKCLSHVLLLLFIFTRHSFIHSIFFIHFFSSALLIIKTTSSIHPTHIILCCATSDLAFKSRMHVVFACFSIQYFCFCPYRVFSVVLFGCALSEKKVQNCLFRGNIFFLGQCHQRNTFVPYLLLKCGY